MSVTSHIFWLLCAFGSVALAAVPARTPVIPLLAVSLGCAAGSWWLSFRPIPPLETIGLVIAVAGGAGLYSTRAALPAAVIAGMSSAAWAFSIRGSGAPLAGALLVAAMPAVLTAFLTSTRTAFAPPAVRDEALLLASVLGLAAAVTPGVVAGWKSANVLNIHDAAQASTLPAWTLGLIAAVVGAGGAYTWWRRA